MADQGSEGMLSPLLRRLRFNVARPYLKRTILDVGCGAGTLAGEVSSVHYYGVEVDGLSLDKAIKMYPMHKFSKSLPDSTEKFDTIISLAVIEHVDSPELFMLDLSKRLKNEESARIVITTPHPSMDWIHDVGASIGLFSKHANEEHEELLDRVKLESVGAKAGLHLVLYKRFLFGANQLAVFEHRR